MNMRIVKPPLATPQRKGKPRKEASYLDFIRSLPCCVTGKHGVEAAHVSFPNTRFGAYGRGKGTKVPDRWSLPLSPEEHRKQHDMNEEDYWANCTDCHPHMLAVIIYGLWNELGSDAHQFCEARIMEGILK